MSKYTLHVTNNDAGWVGHAIENEAIVFTTETLPDPQSCSQALVKFVAAQPNSSYESQALPATDATEDGRPVAQPVTPQEPVRKCCGRG